MSQYLLQVQDSLQQLDEWTVEKIPRAGNMQADALEWTSSIKTYLRSGALPEDSKHTHRTRVQAARFTLIGDYLYRRLVESPICLAELHEGVCGNHSGGRSLAHRAQSQGYYWPTMKQDAKAYVKKCDKCQRYGHFPYMPFETLNSITSPWSFAQWGMDIVGPLHTTVAQKKFLLVATNYFNKWVEAEAYANIKDKDVTSGSNQQNTVIRIKEKAGASQWKMGRRVAWHLVGLSDNT
ncbi:hypothetical protein AAG906_019711 [Vitis piasezkii]